MFICWQIQIQSLHGTGGQPPLYSHHDSYHHHHHHYDQIQPTGMMMGQVDTIIIITIVVLILKMRIPMIRMIIATMVRSNQRGTRPPQRQRLGESLRTSTETAVCHLDDQDDQYDDRCHQVDEYDHNPDGHSADQRVDDGIADATDGTSNQHSQTPSPATKIKWASWLIFEYFENNFSLLQNIAGVVKCIPVPLWICVPLWSRWGEGVGGEYNKRMIDAWIIMDTLEHLSLYHLGGKQLNFQKTTVYLYKLILN